MKIEIIIPAYNCTKTLHRTLSSLECQTDTDFSVHVIDDCSTEDINPIVDVHKTLNIRVTRNEKNIGCGMTRQVGIDSTTADYIAFLDSDDVLMPYTVETWRCMAQSNPDVDMFHSYFYEQQPQTLITRKYGYTWCHGKLYKVNFIRKWDIRNNPEVKLADDSFFNSMCVELGKFATIEIPMYMWLNNSESITRSGDTKFQFKLFDFVHAMKLATEFLKGKGIKEINHMRNTLSYIQSDFDKFNDEILNEYNALLALLDEMKK